MSWKKVITKAYSPWIGEGTFSNPNNEVNFSINPFFYKYKEKEYSIEGIWISDVSDPEFFIYSVNQSEWSNLNLVEFNQKKITIGTNRITKPVILIDSKDVRISSATHFLDKKDLFLGKLQGIFRYKTGSSQNVVSLQVNEKDLSLKSDYLLFNIREIELQFSTAEAAKEYMENFSWERDEQYKITGIDWSSVHVKSSLYKVLKLKDFKLEKVNKTQPEPNSTRQKDNKDSSKKEDPLSPEEKQRQNDTNKYNDEYQEGNHPTIKEFNKLRKEVFDNIKNYNKFKSVNSKLVEEIQTKEGDIKQFQSLQPSDDEKKIEKIKEFNDKELEKIEEVIKLMNQLIASKNWDNNREFPKEDNIQKIRQTAIKLITASLSKNPQITASELAEENRDWEQKISDADSKTVDIITKRVLADISEKRIGKQKATELNSNLQFQEGDSYEKLEEKFIEIEKSDGLPTYESEKEKRKELEQKLAKKNPQSYKNKVIQIVNDKLNLAGLQLNDLGQKGVELVEKLKKTAINDFLIISELREQISQIIGEKGAVKKLDKLINNAKNCLNKGLRNEGEKLKNQILGFISSTNVYCQKVYRDKKESVNNLLVELETSSFQITTTPKFPWMPILSVISVVIVLVMLIIMLSRRAKMKKNRIK